MTVRAGCLIFAIIFSLLLPAAAGAQSKTKSKTKSGTPAKSKSKAKSESAKARQRKRALSAASAAKVRRLKKAFVASSELKPMAKQLLEGRAKAAYDAVERFAKKHETEEAGGLAYLLLGYARITDKEPDYDKAVSHLKAARPHARDLADYVEYYLAQAQLAKGNTRDVVVTLDKFVQRFPDSLLRRDATLTQSRALMAVGANEEAADTLEPVREPLRPEIELQIGRSRRAAGQNERALAAFRNVYYGMPTASEADDAGAALKQMGAAASLEDRKRRAELLVRGRQFGQAAVEYRQLLAEAPSAELEVALANVYSKLDREGDAKQLLVSADVARLGSDAKAQRLYLLAEIARDENDDAAQESYIRELQQLAPSGGWTQEAALSAGNKFLLRRDFENAMRWYEEGWRGFGKTLKSATMHWRAAWLNYRLGRFGEARRIMEEQVEQFAFANETANALYWLGRIAEQEQKPAMARAYYGKLTSRFQNYYYGLLARDRMAAIGPGETAAVAALDRIPGTAAFTPAEESDGENVRFQKAKLLSNAALYELAIKELQTAAADPGNKWADAEMIRMYQEAGKHFYALRRAKQVVPSYLTVDIEALPKFYAEALFPRPYWDELYRSATGNGLDPYLVASLIRQESEFNPDAISRANAYGLMQLLPEVGRQTARQIKMRDYSTASFLEPGANLKLGSKYFRQMVDEYGGQVEYALAAYNAGVHRVAEWRMNGTYKDMAEFVESIPFTETREYVQAITRNREIYKKLYERPGGTRVAGAND